MDTYQTLFDLLYSPKISKVLNYQFLYADEIPIPHLAIFPARAGVFLWTVLFL